MQSHEPVCNQLPDKPAASGTYDFSLLDDVPFSNSGREAAAWELLRSAGCESMERQFVGERFGNNLVCELAGETESQLLIGAHYDRHGVSSGVADNWTGVAAVIAMVRYFRVTPTAHTMRFVLFAGEEKDLRGSRLYVEQSDLPMAMINLDTLGIDTLKLDVNSQPELQCIAQAVSSSLGSELTVSYIRDITGDWQPFRSSGVPVLAFHALNKDLLKRLHGPADRRELINDKLLSEAYDVILNTVVELDRRLQRDNLPVTR